MRRARNARNPSPQEHIWDGLQWSATDANLRIALWRYGGSQQSAWLR